MNKRRKKPHQPSAPQGDDVKTAAASSSAAILSPVADLLCCGGLSLIAVVCLLVAGKLGFLPAVASAEIQQQDIALLFLLNTLLNWPHFMASYRVLYRSPASIRKHPVVSMVLPAAFLVLLVISLLTAGNAATSSGQPVGVDAASQQAATAGLANALLNQLLYTVAAILLAWHYTGQSWGMTATFLFLGGIRMSAAERISIRLGYRSLLIFHVLFVLKSRDISGPLSEYFPSMAWAVHYAYTYWWVVLLLSFAAGLWGFFTMARRKGMAPPVRAWLPWLATYSWYVLIANLPALFFVLQLSHALQYLCFTTRVELNQYVDKQRSEERDSSQTWIHLLGYYLILVLVGSAAFDGIRWLTAEVDPVGQLAALVAVIINIHHYFIDGAIWKIRDPEVRQQVFGHLQAAS